MSQKKELILATIIGLMIITPTYFLIKGKAGNVCFNKECFLKEFIKLNNSICDTENLYEITCYNTTINICDTGINKNIIKDLKQRSYCEVIKK